MSPAGFEPTISAIELPQNQTLDHAATGIAHLKSRGHRDQNASTTSAHKLDNKKHLFASELLISLNQVSYRSWKDKLS
jgi:hypothetical protein